MITGKQRLRNVMTKVKIIARRDMEAFLRGEVGWIRGWQDQELLAAEFDRLHARIEELERTPVGCTRWRQ